MIRPPIVAGYRSPYPTVVNVTAVYQRALPILSIPDPDPSSNRTSMKVKIAISAAMPTRTRIKRFLGMLSLLWTGQFICFQLNSGNSPL